MDSENIKEKIKVAKEAVKDESEPFKTQAFKIILEKLLSEEKKVTETVQPYLKTRQTKKQSVSSPTIAKSAGKKYVGPSGGIRFLIDNNFFSNPRPMKEVFEELKKEGYYYSLQSVDTTLRRNFVFRKKSLMRTKIGSVWKYVNRK